MQGRITWVQEPEKSKDNRRELRILQRPQIVKGQQYPQNTKRRQVLRHCHSCGGGEGREAGAHPRQRLVSAALRVLTPREAPPSNESHKT